MDLRDWLTAVAMRNGSTPGNSKHYHGFATKIRQDFPRLPFTDDTAKSVGVSLGGQFPTWEELRGAIKATMTEITGQEAPRPNAQRVLTGAEREAEDARLDREWWEDRIARVASLPTATEAWREATGMLATLTRPQAYRRPWAIDRLRAIIANTAEAGADTDLSAVRFPREVTLKMPPLPKSEAA
jgi:hypothetical protein